MSPAPAPPRLRNLGPKSAAWLRQVGLRTRDDLAATGPVEAYMRVRRAGFRPGLNLLYAIEWWVFGAFAVFIWVRWCGDSLEAERRLAATAEDEAPQPQAAQT